MPIDLDFDPDVQRYRADVHEWAMAEVRPWARTVDRLHGAPPRDEVRRIIDACPAVVDDEGEWPRSQGQYLLGTLFIDETSYGDHWINWEMQGAGIGSIVIKMMGTAEQKAKYVGGLKAGTFNRAAFALTESHFGSDPSQVATTATRDGDTWILNGTKIYCTGGANSDVIVVFATIDKSLGPAAIRAFVVEKGTPGFTSPRPNEEKLGIRSSMTSELLFDDACIPIDACLGWTGDEAVVAATSSEPKAGPKSGFIGAITTLDSSRPGLAAMSLGMARASIDTAADWFAERRPYFTPERRARIDDDLRHLREYVDRARRVVYRAAWMRDRGLSNRREASIAKAYGPPVAEQVIRRCAQLMGPDGWSEDYLVEKWHRDVKIFDIFEGSGQIQRMIISRASMGSSAARA